MESDLWVALLELGYQNIVLPDDTDTAAGFVYSYYQKHKKLNGCPLLRPEDKKILEMFYEKELILTNNSWSGTMSKDGFYVEGQNLACSGVIPYFDFSVLTSDM